VPAHVTRCSGHQDDCICARLEPLGRCLCGGEAEFRVQGSGLKFWHGLVDRLQNGAPSLINPVASSLLTTFHNSEAVPRWARVSCKLVYHSILGWKVKTREKKSQPTRRKTCTQRHWARWGEQCRPLDVWCRVQCVGCMVLSVGCSV